MKTSSKPKSVTIYDIARVTGLSKTTVSDCLRGNGRIAPETREQVMKAAQEMGYEGNYYAQRLKGGSANVVGLVTLALDMHTLMQRVLRIQQLLNERGFDVPIHGTGLRAMSQPVDQAAMFRELRRQKTKGIICHSWDLMPASLDELRRYMDEGGHVACFGSLTLDLPCDQVIFDAQHSVYEATRHLLELGHTRIGLLPTGNLTPDHPWYSGWHSALAESGIKVRRQWLMCPDSHGFFYGEEGMFLAEKFLDWNTRKSGPRPTALCIINDHVAAAFVNTLLRAGCRVPEDVSIVSYDDTPVARYSIVQLTAARYPVEEIATQTVELLCSRMDGTYHGKPRQIVIQSGLSIRESTAPLVT